MRSSTLLNLRCATLWRSQKQDAVCQEQHLRGFTSDYALILRPLQPTIVRWSRSRTMSEPSPFWKQKVIQLSYGLLPMFPYEIHDCFPSIRPRSLVFTAVSLINIIVITCVSVIFTPSSFPKQISLGKKSRSRWVPIFFLLPLVVAARLQTL